MNAKKIRNSSSGHYSRVRDPFYQSALWRKFRAGYKQRHPYCVDCEEKGIITEMVVLDHIHQRSKGGADFPDDSGLRGLCVSCDAIRQAEQSKKSKI